MSTFHPFPRLPTELCQRIWELSMTSRKVIIRFDSRNLLPQAPALLHTCKQAQSYLQRYYTKSFRSTRRPKQYIWVNFDLDVIYVNQYDPARFPAVQSLVQHLILEANHTDSFYDHTIGDLRKMVALKTVTVLDRAPHSTLHEWWQQWDAIMEDMYFRDDAVPFYTKILSRPSCKVPEINPDNYLKVDRDHRRAMIAANPEDHEEGAQVSDSDDDVDAPHRFRGGWLHVEGCNCPSRRSS